jgi:hypothetical protein
MEVRMAEQKQFPHGNVEQITDGLWRVVGNLSFPLLRNMIIYRLQNGDLLLHSMIALSDAGFSEIANLGKIAYAIVPSKAHQMDAPFYRKKFPELQILAPRDSMKDIAVEVKLSGAVEDVLPTLGFKLHGVPGVKVFEYVYEVPLAGGGKALIVNDAFASNHSYDESRFMSRFLRPLFGVPNDKLGLARIYRWFIVQRPLDLKKFGRELAQIPDVRVLTVSHGSPQVGDVAASLIAAMA